MLQEKAGGVMPNYGISYSEDESLGEEVGGAYSEYKMNLLRDNGYDGFVLTDWQVTEDADGAMGSRAFGVEDLTEGERFAKLLRMALTRLVEPAIQKLQSKVIRLWLMILVRKRRSQL